MLIHYLKTALRNLARHRFFSIINIIGLAVAMSVAMILIMLVADQMSFDRHIAKGDRIYRINTIGVDEKGQIIDRQENSSSPMPLAAEVLERYTGIEQAVRFVRGFGNSWLEFENQSANIPLAGFFADANVLEVFQYELQYGDAATALKAPYSVVLTRKSANKLFNEENPVGQIIKVGELGSYTVTGVLKETNNKSHIVFEGLASISTIPSLEQAGKLEKMTDSWTNCWNGWTYIVAEQGKTENDLQLMLDNIYAKHIVSITDPEVYKIKFLLQPLFKITPGSHKNNPIGPQLPWDMLYFLGGLALVILLTSCFNFTNLSIARSLARAREIGVRKVTGAARWQIFSQFISEAIVIAMFALTLALVFVYLLEPFVLQLNFARIFYWSLSSNAMVYVTFILFAFTVGILAGFFPAVVLSGFQPIQVLKSLSNMKLLSRMGLRKALLVSQFTVSLFFILTVLIAYDQLRLFTNQDHGFNVNNNIVVKLNDTSAQNLKNELQKHANITTITAASHLPAAGTSNGNGFKRSKDDAEFINTAHFEVDEDYAANMQLHLLAGEFFKPENAASNKNMIVINEVALTAFRFESPQDAIGQSLVHQSDSIEKIIIGVVANYNHRTLTHQIEPLALQYDPNAYHVLQVSYAGSYQQASKTIEDAWAAVNPGLKIDYTEVKSEIDKFYDLVFGDLVKILGFISVLAILLSCLGLLGMAMYVTETRIKEVSIRKVLGSGNAELVMLLSRGFLSMLGIAIAIGIPLAIIMNNLWLELIAYHTEVGLGIISQGVFILLITGALTIGSQTWRAMFINPVEILKNE